MARSSLTREEVLGAAAALVRQHGPEALTMRKLAAELGTAVTSIYWHVGNRESLLDALVERTVQEMGAVRPAGPAPPAPQGTHPPGDRWMPQPENKHRVLCVG
ncbi:TetR family transcriptional regulator, partial [Streptomyces sp. NPDC005098]|uniref:TetR/AcrR family transcriptional regulator n=1 Tax=Streptomyces sp. NPDC005098 TaxID=3154560 RepID=UPI0033A1ADC1